MLLFNLLNIYMNSNSIETEVLGATPAAPSEPSLPKKTGWGGKREGAGRPAGRKDQLTVGKLLDEVYKQTGRDYHEVLVEDFVRARQDDDKPMVTKYHQLILSKVMNTLARVEVTDSEDAIEAKKMAFAAALAELMAKSEE